MKWYNNPNESITIGGFAGTGKTTSIAYFRRFLNSKIKISVAFCSYTGKAVRILEQKLKDFNALYKNDSVSTIHSLLYEPRTNADGEIIGWSRKENIKFDLIVVDEASMVDQLIWNDLLQFTIPIIAVGDHGQLPPIHGNFNLMQKPQLTLEEIHRQSKGNPIISLSAKIRKHQEINPQEFSTNVKKLDKTDESTFEEVQELLNSNLEDTLVLCGFNATRVRLNQSIRHNLEFFEETPQPGDRVICLKNNHEKRIANGMLGKIETMEDHDEYFHAHIKMDNGNLFAGEIDPESFNNKDSSQIKKIKGIDYFDYGYALTVHKAQGSQAKRVILFEERSQHMDDDTWFRWLYTGVTRAEEELYIIG